MVTAVADPEDDFEQRFRQQEAQLVADIVNTIAVLERVIYLLTTDADMGDQTLAAFATCIATSETVAHYRAMRAEANRRNEQERAS